MKPIAYLDFDLQIERIGDSYRAQVLNSPAGNATHTFSMPFAPLELENYQLRLSAMRQNTRGGRSPEAETAKSFGGKLFETVFDGDVQGCLHRSLDLAIQQGKGLRLRLRLTEAPDLLDLPWEYLYNRTRNLFYALSVETPLVRYLEMPEQIAPLALTPPLRVLVMIASPTNYPPLEVEREWQKLRTAVRKLEERGLVVLERLEQPTVSALRERLNGDDCHMFHFIGHGEFDPHTKDGTLIMERDDRLGARVSGESLGMLMRDHRRNLRLVLLNACEGGRTSTEDPFAGTAQRLIQQGIPAVIAMQFEVTDETAITFAQEFYAALTYGFPVDAALAEARKAVSIEAQGAEWGTPVLYMRAPDGQIFDVKEPSKPEVIVNDGPTQEAQAADKPDPSDAVDVASRDLVPPQDLSVTAVQVRSEPPGGASYRLESPEGAMNPESPFYIERLTDAIAIEVIARSGGETITIKGPRQVGKSSLLMRMKDVAERNGKRVAYLDFQQIGGAALVDANVFFRQFCSWLTDVLELPDRVDEHWNVPLGNSQLCTRYVSRYLLPALDAPLVLAMDEVESIFDTAFQSDFFGMLRSWHNGRAGTPIWRKLDLALITSTEPYQLIKNLNQSPFNVGQTIDLADFTAEQIGELNRRHGALLGSSDERRLFDLLGGHPYLMRRALYMIGSKQISADTLFDHAADDHGPFGDHLRHHLFRIHHDKEQVRALRQVISRHSCDDETIFWRLHGAGLIRRESTGEIVPRNRLYQAYFKERLHD